MSDPEHAPERLPDDKEKVSVHRVVVTQDRLTQIYQIVGIAVCLAGCVLAAIVLLRNKKVEAPQ